MKRLLAAALACAALTTGCSLVHHGDGRTITPKPTQCGQVCTQVCPPLCGDDRSQP